MTDVYAVSTIQEFIYIIRAARPEMLSAGATEDEERLVDAHFDYIKGMVDDGTVQFVGRTMTTDPGTIGIVIFRAESDSKAHEIMAGDPAVQHGVFSAEVRPFATILTAPR